MIIFIESQQPKTILKQIHLYGRGEGQIWTFWITVKSYNNFEERSCSSWGVSSHMVGGTWSLISLGTSEETFCEWSRLILEARISKCLSEGGSGWCYNQELCNRSFLEHGLHIKGWLFHRSGHQASCESSWGDCRRVTHNCDTLMSRWAFEALAFSGALQFNKSD